ncbi:hypothetical protein C4D60_Mb02t20770 [Musa balbisiana]|uniref:Uncharacterized protein n=1 Tax=Musa balbisiana TaxID=52838 RepID=A0A4S8ICB1_MUSBA|nr:hypothetical protein C4D60_Mb02t20770 [Musa balbisiana]
MGTGDWLKTIISRKKKNKERPKQDSADQPLKLKSLSHNDPNKLLNGALNGNSQDCGMTIEVIAAIRIQTAFRGFKARKTLGSLRRTQKLQAFTYHNSVKKQTTNTLIHVHAWSKIQAEIRARRANMVAEGRIRQKKHDNQLKLEAKLHDLEQQETLELCITSDKSRLERRQRDKGGNNCQDTTKRRSFSQARTSHGICVLSSGLSLEELAKESCE